MRVRGNGFGRHEFGRRRERIVEAAIPTGSLGAVQPRRRQFLGQIVQYDLVEMPHRGEGKMAEVRSQVVPQCSLGPQLFPH